MLVNVLNLPTLRELFTNNENKKTLQNVDRLEFKLCGKKYDVTHFLEARQASGMDITFTRNNSADEKGALNIIKYQAFFKKEKSFGDEVKASEGILSEDIIQDVTPDGEKVVSGCCEAIFVKSGNEIYTTNTTKNVSWFTHLLKNIKNSFNFFSQDKVGTQAPLKAE